MFIYNCVIAKRERSREYEKRAKMLNSTQVSHKGLMAFAENIDEAAQPKTTSTEYFNQLGNKIRDRSDSKRNMFLLNKDYFLGSDKINLCNCKLVNLLKCHRSVSMEEGINRTFISFYNTDGGFTKHLIVIFMARIRYIFS